MASTNKILGWSEGTNDNAPVFIHQHGGGYTYNDSKGICSTLSGDCTPKSEYSYEFVLNNFSEYEGRLKVSKVGASSVCQEEMLVCWFTSCAGRGFSGKAKTLDNEASSSNFVTKNVDDCAYIITKNNTHFVTETNFNSNSYEDNGFPRLTSPFGGSIEIGHKVKYLVTGYTIPSSCITNSNTCNRNNNGVLTELYFPHSSHDESSQEHVVKYISANAFCDNHYLSAITFGNSVVTIGNGAFSGCSGLTVVDWSHGAKYDEDGIPTWCEYVSVIRTIGNSAFKGCTSLHELYGECGGCIDIIPDSVETIGESAFADCTSLSSITFGTRISHYSSDSYNSNIRYIGDYAFSGCSSLETIIVNRIIPPALGSNAFYNTNLSTIYVPSVSVNAYKQASGWSDYESQIQAIE